MAKKTQETPAATLLDEMGQGAAAVAVAGINAALKVNGMEPIGNEPDTPAPAKSDVIELDGPAKLKLIADKNARVCHLAAVFRHKAEDAKDAKKSWEAAGFELSALIDRLTRPPEPLPLFDKPAAEAWRDLPLTAPPFSGAVMVALQNAGISTVGALADWTNAGNLLTDIPGVGPAKAEEIEEALTAFWLDHPEYSSPAPAGSEPDPASRLFPSDYVEAYRKAVGETMDTLVGLTEEVMSPDWDAKVAAANAEPTAPDVAAMVAATLNDGEPQAEKPKRRKGSAA